MRHNEIRDTFASVMKEVCFDVEIEPKLQPLEGESFVHKTTTTEDEARLDIKANGLWDSRFCKTFFDVKIFNPLARTCPKNVNDAYKFHESQKKLKYESRIINVGKKAPLTPNLCMYRWRWTISHKSNYPTSCKNQRKRIRKLHRRD